MHAYNATHGLQENSIHWLSVKPLMIERLVQCYSSKPIKAGAHWIDQASTLIVINLTIDLKTGFACALYCTASSMNSLYVYVHVCLFYPLAPDSEFGE